jgi:hypothetical protein
VGVPDDAGQLVFENAVQKVNRLILVYLGHGHTFQFWVNRRRQRLPASFFEDLRSGGLPALHRDIRSPWLEPAGTYLVRR